MENAALPRASSSPTIPIAAIVLAAGAVSGALWFQRPYRTQRPHTEIERFSDESISLAPVIARLWQDPLSVVEDYRKALRKEQREQKDLTGEVPPSASKVHSFDGLRAQIAKELSTPEALSGRRLIEGRRDSDPELTVLPVLVPGGYGPVDVEARVRERHAVVSALGRMEYGPRWDKRISFLDTHWRFVDNPTNPDQETIELVRGGSEDSVYLAIPYEWFDYRPHEATAPSEEQRPKHVLVLWVNDGFFQPFMLSALDRLVLELVDDSVLTVQALEDDRLQLRALGPPNSTSLFALFDEARKRVDETRREEGDTTGQVPEFARRGSFSDGFPSTELRTLHLDRLIDKALYALGENDDEVAEIDRAPIVAALLALEDQPTPYRTPTVRGYIETLLRVEDEMTSLLAAELGLSDARGTVYAAVDRWQRWTIYELAGGERIADPSAIRDSLRAEFEPPELVAVRTGRSDLLLSGYPNEKEIDDDLAELAAMAGVTEDEKRFALLAPVRADLRPGEDDDTRADYVGRLVDAIDELANALRWTRLGRETTETRGVVHRWWTGVVGDMGPEDWIAQRANVEADLEDVALAGARRHAQLTLAQLSENELPRLMARSFATLRSEDESSDELDAMLWALIDNGMRNVEWGVLLEALRGSKITTPRITDSFLDNLPLYLLSDDAMTTADASTFSDALRRQLPGLWLEGKGTERIGSMSSSEIVDWLIDSAETRRHALLASPLVQMLDWNQGEGAPSKEAQILFELARWDYALADYIEPDDSRTYALYLQFLLEQSLFEGIPRTVDRSKLIRQVAGIIGEYYTFGRLYRTQSSLPALEHLRRAVASFLPEVRDDAETSFSIAQAIASFLTSEGATEARDGSLPPPGEKEYRRSHGRIPSVLPYVHLFNSHATASREAGSGSPRKASGPERRHGVETDLADVLEPKGKYESLTMDDATVLAEVVEELPHRGFDTSGKHRIALISEWDTFYGDNLPRQFVEVMQSRADKGDGERYGVDYVEFYDYIRGLDGAQARDDTREAEASESPLALDGALNLATASTLERPEGASQFDYIRRLTERLVERERALNRKGKRFFAFGVLGSDVYDKLLVLQALRERFPRALFFTTDLDARLFSPKNANLIVASPYGLELSDDLQGTVAPFRDSYQTGTFLACQKALGGIEGLDAPQPPAEDEQPDPASPGGAAPQEPTGALIAAPSAPAEPSPSVRLFELTRQGAVDLSPKPGGPLYGVPDAGRPRLSTLFATAMIVVLLFGVLVPFSRRLQAWVFRAQLRPTTPFGEDSFGERERRALDVLALTLFVGTVLWAWGVLSDHTPTLGSGSRPEPFFLIAGVSAWPTYLGRLLGIALAAYFLLHSHARVRSSCEELQPDLGASKEGV